jgi:hypothetical protein
MATATEWTCMFVVILITPIAVTNIGYRVYLIFVVTTIFSYVFCSFTYPDTTGCALEEMDLYFEHIRSWDVRETYNIRKTLDRFDLNVGAEEVHKTEVAEVEIQQRWAARGTTRLDKKMDQMLHNWSQKLNNKN